MARSKKTVKELFNEQPDDVKQMIEFIAAKAYTQGFRDATNCEMDTSLTSLANDIVQEIRR